MALLTKFSNANSPKAILIDMQQQQKNPPLNRYLPFDLQRKQISFNPPSPYTANCGLLRDVNGMLCHISTPLRTKAAEANAEGSIDWRTAVNLYVCRSSVADTNRAPDDACLLTDTPSQRLSRWRDASAHMHNRLLLWSMHGCMGGFSANAQRLSGWAM